MRFFVKGFLAGLFCGAAAGLLLSPRSGLENRALFFQRFQEALEAGRGAARAQDARMRARFRRTIEALEED